MKLRKGRVDDPLSVCLVVRHPSRKLTGRSTGVSAQCEVSRDENGLQWSEERGSAFNGSCSIVANAEAVYGLPSHVHAGMLFDCVVQEL